MVAGLSFTIIAFLMLTEIVLFRSYKARQRVQKPPLRSGFSASAGGVMSNWGTIIILPLGFIASIVGADSRLVNCPKGASLSISCYRRYDEQYRSNRF